MTRLLLQSDDSQQLYRYHTPYSESERRTSLKHKIRYTKIDYVKTCIYLWYLIAFAVGMIYTSVWMYIQGDITGNIYITFEGECIILDRYKYAESECKTGCSRDGACSESCRDYVIHEYTLQVYNHSACNRYQNISNYTFEMDDEVDFEYDPYKYAINESIICYSDEYCDEVSIDRGSINYSIPGTGWIIGGVIIGLISLCLLLCICVLFSVSLMICCCKEAHDDIIMISCLGYIWSKNHRLTKKEYENYQNGSDKVLYNVNEWRKMNPTQKIDYFVNYYGREYELGLHNIIFVLSQCDYLEMNS